MGRTKRYYDQHDRQHKARPVGKGFKRVYDDYEDYVKLRRKWVRKCVFMICIMKTEIPHHKFFRN